MPTPEGEARQPLRRLRAELRLKLTLSLALMVFFSVPYFTLQRFPLRPPQTLPPTAVDRLVPFDPGWTIVYQSLYLLVPVAAWFSASRDSLRRYAHGFVALCAVAFAVFLVFPVAGPRPEAATEGLYGLLVRYDTPLNSFPSLHVALAAYSVLYVGHLAGRTRGLMWTGAAWMAALCYSTLATKQHYAVDLPAGLLLALLAYRWAFAPGARMEVR